MKEAFNIYYITIKGGNFSSRINIFTDSIEKEREEFARKFKVSKSSVVFKIKHLKEKWDDK